MFNIIYFIICLYHYTYSLFSVEEEVVIPADLDGVSMRFDDLLDIHGLITHTENTDTTNTTEYALLM